MTRVCLLCVMIYIVLAKKWRSGSLWSALLPELNNPVHGPLVYVKHLCHKLLGLLSVALMCRNECYPWLSSRCLGLFSDRRVKAVFWLRLTHQVLLDVKWIFIACKWRLSCQRLPLLLNAGRCFDCLYLWSSKCFQWWSSRNQLLVLRARCKRGQSLLFKSWISDVILGGVSF